MADRLDPLDVSFLYRENPTTPMHVGNLAVFAPPEGGFDHDRLVRLIRNRIAFVPRYRQRVRHVPGRVARPVWVDDEHFDVSYHVRRSALPRPGTIHQLRDLVARIFSRPLDLQRPLWEMYLIEGLAEGRFAILTKSHSAMIDGMAAVDIGQVILDVTPEPRELGTDVWRAAREPGSVELLAGGVMDTLRSPAEVWQSVSGRVGNVRENAAELSRTVTGMLTTATASVVRPPTASPLNVDVGGQRRFSTADTDLADYRRIRTTHGGTVNDVVLAVITGALRDWLMARGEKLTARTTLRALVPVSQQPTDGAGAEVAPVLCDLPVGEPAPVVRLQRLAFDMRRMQAGSRPLDAEQIAGMAGFAPPTLHAIGVRAAAGLTHRMANLVITNVPGPQFPLFAAGSRMLATYPVLPLERNQALSVGLTSYDGGVHYGLNGDRDALPDIDTLAECLVSSLVELLDTTTPSGHRRSLRS